jgi:hypothetical protein
MDLSQIVGNQETVTNSQGGKQSRLDVRFDLIPALPLFKVASVLKEGATKYGEWNWKKISMVDHINHALSHIYAYLAGDKSDEHLTHAACRILFAIDTQTDKNGHPPEFVSKSDYERLARYCIALECQLERYKQRGQTGSDNSDETGDTETQTP